MKVNPVEPEPNKEKPRKVKKHEKEIAALYEYLQALLEPPKLPNGKLGISSTKKNNSPL